jgi:choline kinase
LSVKIFVTFRSIASKSHPNITETTKHIFQGESIGIIKLSNDYRIKLVEFMDQLFCEEYNKSIKLDKLLIEFIKKHHFVAFKTKSDKWMEIDTSEDYKKAIAFSQKIPPVG